MTIHILDIVFWFVSVGIIWWLLDYFSNGEYTNELGGLIGLTIIIIYTIIYIILFGFMGYDVANFGELLKDIPIKIRL
jgi:hypothetical protein